MPSSQDGAWLDRLQGGLRGLLALVFAQARSRLSAFAYISAAGRARRCPGAAGR